MDERGENGTRQVLERLGEVLPKKGRVLIIPHDHPDPDALASAGAMELLLSKHFGLRCQIVFTGMVSRAENRELLKHFRYTWKLLGQLRVPKKPVPCIFVDTAPWSGNVTLPSFGKPVAVVDHHPMGSRRGLPGIFTDIRSGRGASASIVAEYLDEADISVPGWLASVMAYAIASETQDLSRGATPEDLGVYTRLLQGANFGVLGRIRHAPLPRAYFGHLAEAMANGRTYGRVAWTHLESVQQPELVAEIADLLLRMERITWAFCTAVMGDRLLISIRSCQKSARCGRLLRRLLARNGSGGGHHNMAAGYVDIGSFTAEQCRKKREQIVRGILAHVDPRIKQCEEPMESVVNPLVRIPVDGDGGAVPFGGPVGPLNS